MAGTLNRALEALGGRDFRLLLAARLLSTAGDGAFQAALVTSIIFSPEHQGTVAGFAAATLVLVLPFSILGPFAGVFIDRWPRRRILLMVPLARAALAGLVLIEPSRSAPAFYAGALCVLSLNRFYLATATAVVPRLVPAGDLLMANSLATIGGTGALLAGVFLGGLVADAAGTTLPLVVAAAAAWLVASLAASRIGSELAPHPHAASPELLRHALRRVSVEFVDGMRHLAHAPRALAPIASMSLDQLGQGLVLVVSLFVFRERFREGVGSFSWLVAAGGVGVLLGLVTVGRLEERTPKERIIAGAFALSGLALVLASTRITPWSVLLASFAVGLTFAWKKVPSDTLVQEAVPDAYRGRVFAAYDVVYQASRVVAAALAVPMLPSLGAEWSVAVTGLVFLAWTPVVPAWIAGSPALEIRFYEGARAEEWPRAIVRGGVEERVEVVRAWREEREGIRLACFRLALVDGTVLDVCKPEGRGRWRVDRELET